MTYLWIRQQSRIIVLRWYQFCRLTQRSYQHLTFLIPKSVLRQIGLSVIIIFTGSLLWTMSTHLRLKAQAVTQEYQQKALLQSRIYQLERQTEERLNALALTKEDVLTKMPSAASSSLNEIVTSLRDAVHIEDLQIETHELQPPSPQLASISIRLSFQANKEAQIYQFLTQFVRKIPGFVNFEELNIQRIRKILSQHELKRQRLAAPLATNSLPHFSTRVQAQLIVPHDVLSILLPAPPSSAKSPWPALFP